jgi:predicted permease
MKKRPSIAREVQYACRSVLKNPRVFVVAALTLGLAIGATTASLSIVDGIFFRPLPGVQRMEQLVALYTDNRSTPQIDYGSLSYLDYSQHYRQATVFSDLAAYARFPIVIGFDDATERVTAEVVSGNYFKLLETKPHIGRLISSEDDSPESMDVVVISYRLWASRLGQSKEIIGKVIPVNGRPVAIVGVAPEGFYGTNMDWDGRPDIWLPMAIQPQIFDANLLRLPVPWHLAVGRLRDGVSREQAQAVLQSMSSNIGRADNAGIRGTQNQIIALALGEARFFPAYRSRLALFTGSLTGISVLTLLIAAFNATNLLLVRMLSRTKEFAIKLALGANSWQLVLQLGVENSSVSLAAGALGLWIASWTPALIDAFPRPFRTPVDPPLQLDLRITGLTLLVTLVLLIALSLAPLAHISYRRLSSALKSEIGSTRITINGRLALRAGLLVQVALGTMLAATAGLGIRSVRNLEAVNPGFRTEGVLVSNLDLRNLQPQRRSAFLQRLQTNLPALSSLEAAALAGEAPGVRRLRRIRQEGEQTALDASLSYVTPGYFGIVSIAISEGQEFAGLQDASRAVIINHVIAERFWPNLPTAGKRIRIDGETTDREVRAVVRTSKCTDSEDERQACLYMPLSRTAPQATVLFRPEANSDDAAISEIRDQVRQLDPNVAIYETKTLSDHVRSRFSGQSLLGSMAAILAVIALVILSAGMVALVSFTIAQTRRSMAIRIAVGATPARVMYELLQQFVTVSGVGIVAGVGAMLALAPAVRSQLYEISPWDPLTLAGAAILLSVICLGACAIAAGRVVRIDPVVTLRSD